MLLVLLAYKAPSNQTLHDRAAAFSNSLYIDSTCSLHPLHAAFCTGLPPAHQAPGARLPKSEKLGPQAQVQLLQKAVKGLPVRINIDLVCRYQKIFILKPLAEILYLLLQHGKSLLRRHVGKLGNIKHIQQQPGALNMLEKLQPQALSLRGALNDARYVGHHKRAEVGQLNHTHHRIAAW